MISRLSNALKGRSVGEIAFLIGKNLIYPIQKLTPHARRARARDRIFDQTWGTDTSAKVNLSELKVDRDLARHGVRYQASDSDWLLAILDSLSLPLADFSFVDFGSGKGRIVLTASLRPFREIYGVEFSPELVAVAEGNLEIFARRNTGMAPVKIVCCDAAAFELPPGNLVCYFYNPFDEHVMAKVVAKLEAALEGGERDIRVIYHDPVCRHLFDASGLWTANELEGTLIFSSQN